MLAALTAASTARANPTTPRFGDVSVEVGVGHGLTLMQGFVGRTTSAVIEPVMLRTLAGVHLGGGLWVEGGLRGTFDDATGAVRTMSPSVGLRLNMEETSTFAIFVRLGYAAIVTDQLVHGGYTAIGALLRVWRPIGVFVEGGFELFPVVTYDRTTANARVQDGSAFIGLSYWMGGLRVSL